MNTLPSVKTKVAQFLFPQIPETEIDSAINAAVNEKIRPLVSPDTANPFGSKWGEITAKMSAQVLGITVKEVKNQLTVGTPTKAKTEQGLQSAILKRRIKDDFKDNGLEVARETRLNAQMNFWRLRAKELGCDNIQSERVINCLLEIVDSQAEFGSLVNFQTLLSDVSKAVATNSPITLNALRCPPQEDSETEGIRVNPTIRFETKVASGTTGVVDHEVIFQKIAGVRNIFDKWEIPLKTKITLVDVDAFIKSAPNLSERVSEFEQNITPVIQRILPGAEVETITRILGINRPHDFFDRTGVKEITSNPRSRFGEKHVEKMVDDCFDKLKPRRLPPAMKTRQKAREFAADSLAVEFELGKTIGAEDGQIWLERSITSSAADTFLIGAKGEGKKPPFLFFWVDRVAIKE